MIIKGNEDARLKFGDKFATATRIFGRRKCRNNRKENASLKT